MRILFVEDHAVFAATVQAEFLRGHEVGVVATIAEALDALGTTSFDAVVVDYDLADGKGDAFVRNMRERGHRTPLVAVSAKDEGNERLLAAGADATCSKSKFRHIGKVLERLSPSPTASREVLELRGDWESAKVSVMREAVEAKFRQHDGTRRRHDSDSGE